MQIHPPRSAARRALPLAVATSALALLAPSAQAATRSTDLRLSGFGGVPASAVGGTGFKLTATVTNSGTRTAQAGRFFVGVTKGSTAKSNVSRLGTRNLPAFRAKRRTSYVLEVRPNSKSSGDYRLVICATQAGRRARCVLGPKLTVTKPATPAPAPAPTPPAPTPPAPTPPALPLDQQLRNAMTPAALTEHTNALYEIAQANDGNRAAGTQGYDDSVAYVFKRLVQAGYSPKLDLFDFTSFNELSDATLETNAGRTYEVGTDFATFSYSGSGDTGAGTRIQAIDLGVTPTPDTAPASSNTSGCEPADFASFVEGNIALIKRGTCTFVTKVQNAIDAGAGGVIVFNEGQPATSPAGDRESLLNGTLGTPAEGGEEVPVVGTTAAVGEAIAATTNPTGRITTDTVSAAGQTINVIADTATGDPEKTVVVGSHLDSVAQGAGINDNGSGSAFNLELAEQMSALGVKPANRVRFAFWGAEEAGLIGSNAYVAGLSPGALGQIGLNLNYDMLASPNYARFIYDGDFSDSPRPVNVPLGPGSTDVEKAFEAYFQPRGLATQPTGFNGRSDYAAFQNRGIPAGGLFSGAEEIKTPAQVALFGGTAGEQLDPNYHEAGDVPANLNLTGFKELSDAAASVTLQYALAPVLPAKASPARRARATSGATGGEWLGSHLQR